MIYKFKCSDEEIEKFLKIIPFKRQYNDIGYSYKPKINEMKFECNRPTNINALEEWLKKNKIPFTKSND
jgi:hypothetical protein